MAIKLMGFIYFGTPCIWIVRVGSKVLLPAV